MLGLRHVTAEQWRERARPRAVCADFEGHVEAIEAVGVLARQRLGPVSFDSTAAACLRSRPCAHRHRSSCGATDCGRARHRSPHPRARIVSIIASADQPHLARRPRLSLGDRGHPRSAATMSTSSASPARPTTARWRARRPLEHQLHEYRHLSWTCCARAARQRRVDGRDDRAAARLPRRPRHLARCPHRRPRLGRPRLRPGAAHEGPRGGARLNPAPGRLAGSASPTRRSRRRGVYALLLLSAPTSSRSPSSYRDDSYEGGRCATHAARWRSGSTCACQTMSRCASTTAAAACAGWCCPCRPPALTAGARGRSARLVTIEDLVGTAPPSTHGATTGRR